MEQDLLVDALAEAVGGGHVLRDPDLMAAYETDWTRRFSGRARLVVRPGDTAEVAAVLAACHAAGAAVVPQGGNTGMVGGGVPRGGEVVLSLTRLDAIDPVDPAAATVSAGAGATLADVQRAAAAAGLVFGVDLAARDTATIGGCIATNAGGIRVARYGAMRAQVRGVEAVLADGRVVQRMGGLVKDNTGYDLPGLLTGSEGTLGVVTRACLRLVPPLEQRVTALLALDDLHAALSVAARLRALPTLDAVEVLFDDGLELTCAHAGLARPFRQPSPCYLLVECAGAEDPTDALAAVLADAPELVDAAVASDRPGREALWAYRERHSEAVSAAGIPLKLDVSLPIGELPGFVEEARARVETVAPGSRTIVWGHLGDGNLHVNVIGPDPDDEAVEDAVLRLVAERGGSISAEHGVGVAKARWLSLTRGAADREAMRAIKHALDPAGILNPGVLFS